MKTRSQHEHPQTKSQEPAGAGVAGPEAPVHSTRQQGQGERIAQLRGQQARSDGLPPALQSGIEALSGMDMSGVRVHRNSGKPAALQAHAYAQGSDIHLGPGQEQHLPHEAWHVVQQAQGRVSPTRQMAGVALNDDRTLEKEADLMGSRALIGRADSNAASDRPFQRVMDHAVLSRTAQPVLQAVLKEFHSDNQPKEIDEIDKEGAAELRKLLLAYEVTSQENKAALADALANLIQLSRDIDATFDDEEYEKLSTQRQEFWDWVLNGRVEATRELAQVVYCLPIFEPGALDRFEGNSRKWVDRAVDDLLQGEPALAEEVESNSGKLSVKYAFASSPAFLEDEAPKVEDVKQGLLGDCWLLAPLISIVNTERGRERIKAMIRPNDQSAHVYTVTLYERDDDTLTQRDFVIPALFPAYKPKTSGERFAFASSGRPVQPAENEQAAPLWPNLIEKAFAKMSSQSYRNLEGSTNGATAAFEGILGLPAPEKQPRLGHVFSKKEIMDHVGKGRMVVVSTGTHYWSVLQADEEACVLRNPHGYTEADTTWKTAQEKFKHYTVHDVQ